MSLDKHSELSYQQQKFKRKHSQQFLSYKYMGQSSSQNQWLKQLDQNYTFVSTVNEVRYGDGKLYANKENPKLRIIYKDIHVPDQSQFEFWQRKLKDRAALKHPNVIEMKSHHLQEEEQMCSTFFRVHLIFEFLPSTLYDVVEERKRSRTYFEENEILSILFQAVNGLAKFQELRIPHQNLRLQTISYNANTIKICDTPLLTTLNAFTAVFQDYSGQLRGFYLSPALVKAIHENKTQPQHNLYKSDVYSLGMNILHVALLKNVDDCYSYEEGMIKYIDLNHLLDEARGIYSSELVDKIEEMVQTDESDRSDFIQLRDSWTRNRPASYQAVSFKPQEDLAQAEDSNFQQSKNYHEQYLQIPNDQLNLECEEQYMEKQQGVQPMQLDECDQAPDQLMENKPTNNNKIDVLINNDELMLNSSVPIKDQRLSTRRSEPKIDALGFQQNYPQRQQSWQPQYNESGMMDQQQQSKQYRQQSNLNSSFQKFSHALPQRQDAQTQYSGVFSSSFNTLGSRFQAQTQPQAEMVKYSYPQEYYKQNAMVDNQKFNFSVKNASLASNYSDFAKYSSHIGEQQNNQRNDYDRILHLSPYQSSNQVKQEKNTENTRLEQFEQIKYDLQNIRPLDQTGRFGQLQRVYVNEMLENGGRYVGQKVNGKKDGTGRLYYREGGYYDGEWKNDMINGQGTLYYASGRPAYDGQWVDDKFQGRGILYNDQPKYGLVDYHNLEELNDAWTKYIGDFSDDCKHGQGVYEFLNGDRFEGIFQYDYADGNGRFIRKNGITIQGYWRQNQFLG